MTPDKNILQAFPAVSDLYYKERWVDLISICNSSSDEELDPSIKNLLRFVCYIYLNNLQVGIGGLESLLVNSGNNVIIFKHLGVGYSLAGNKLLAKLYFEKAFAFSNGDVSISVLYADLLFRLGEFSQSESIYVNSIKSFPSNRQLLKGYVELLYHMENWVKILDAIDLAKFMLPDECELFEEIEARIRSKKLAWFKIGSFCINCGELDYNSTYRRKPYFYLYTVKIAPIQSEVFCYECKAFSKGISTIKSFSDTDVKKIIDDFRINRLLQKATKASSIIDKAAYFIRQKFCLKDQFDLESERKIEIFIKINNIVRCAKNAEDRSPVCLSCFSAKTTPVFTESTRRFMRLTNIVCPKCSERVFEKHKIDIDLNYSFSNTKYSSEYKIIKCDLNCSAVELNECSEASDKNMNDGLQEKPEIFEWNRHTIYRF
jgi:tetratricopeptide (TPR) repeat protein